MAVIDYFLFPISPFTYLAGQRLEQVAARTGAQINYKPFDLMKVFAETGTVPLGQRHESRKRYRLQELERIAAANQMPITLQPAFFPTNPVPACVAIHNVQAAGGDTGAVVHGILRACWVDEKDIAQSDVLAEVLSAHGLDPKLVEGDMVSGVEAYERNTNEALERFVFGAPTYVVGEQVFWGQDRLSHLEQALSTG
ncbi:MAG: 2-hydroxychromene-2-carboxylate isomerase [Pseudomonadota bacterium]